MRRILTYILVAFAITAAAPAVASAALSQVGPPLSSSSSKAANQIESLIRYDDGVNAFVSRQTGISASVLATAEVISAKSKSCIVGSSKTCGYNTGKDGSGNLHTTSFRKGTRVSAYVATIEYEKGKTVKVTFLKPCANVLGTVKVSHTKQRVSPKMAIVVKVIAKSVASCNGGTATASVTTSVKIKSWTSFAKAVASATALCVPAPTAGPQGPIVLTCQQLGKVETSPGSGVCQAQSASTSQEASQDNKVDNDIKCDVKSSSNACSPVTNITNNITQTSTTIQIQGNCSKITVTTGDGNQTIQYKDQNGKVVSNVEEYCTVKTENPPTTPAPTPKPTPTPTPTKNGTDTPSLPSNAPSPNPAPADSNSSKCKWEDAGVYKGISHDSGDDVAASQLGANGACPVGSVGF